MNVRTVANELRRMFPTDWRLQRDYRLPDDDPAQAYYIRWSGKPRPAGEGWDDASTDADGILRCAAFRNPVTLSQFALTKYEAACDGDTEARAAFLRHATWLVESQAPSGLYHYPIELPLYGMQPGWTSGMAQGEAASVLVRAFELTGDSMFLGAGIRALSTLLRDVRDGGVSYLRGADVFFEELATPEASHILNGHLYAAFALWEYCRFVRVGSEYETLQRDAIRTLTRWLPQFDAAGWSYYDLAIHDGGRRHLAPLWYHQFHIAQLRVYAAMTGERAFGEMAAHWYEALSNAAVRAYVWNYGAQSLWHAARRRVLRQDRRAPRPIHVASP